MTQETLYKTDPETGNMHLLSPTKMPKASGFLWNKKMMLHMTCRGFATAQFMQPEPAKYARGPSLEAKTFMQPEHPYFAHHPGRFFYLRDNGTNQLFSAPYEPVKAPLDRFEFISGSSHLGWITEKDGIRLELHLNLAAQDVAELWQATITNVSTSDRNVSLIPYFPLGYMSWMNQSASYDPALNAVIGKCITPYQKVEDYFANQNLLDQTYLMSDKTPDSWLANQEAFEGEGGLHAPDALKRGTLACLEAHYEMPAAIMQFDLELQPGKSSKHKFVFGPAKDRTEILAHKHCYIDDPAAFQKASSEAAKHVLKGNGCLKIKTPDETLNDFVNSWLPRQTYYHGDVNRLSTDPQTRNYLQDHLGMTYIDASVTRASFLTALSQQAVSGEMPDGILLSADAKLKYINQVPHADHCVWLPVCLTAYLSETNDFALLKEVIPFKDSEETASVAAHIDRALEWLIQNKDERGLSYIKQGDWCDPMNMVGYKGKGVSGWLSLATAYALNQWAGICIDAGRAPKATFFRTAAATFNETVNDHLWDANWYARGITDAGVKFGIADDKEGRIFLNPQSWAFLSGAANSKQTERMLSAIDDQLETPYGPAMLAPAYTQMREDVGRVTQKFPGSAENGAVYNHAAIFYAYSLFQIGDPDRAYSVLRRMLPNDDDCLRRGQLPTFIPNYYRGAYHQYPRTAGISSQLFNTGTVAWYYRCVIEELFGLKGHKGDLVINPKLPKEWNNAVVTRNFGGATFTVHYDCSALCEAINVKVDNLELQEARIQNIQAGAHYQVSVTVPKKRQETRIAS